MDNNQLLELFKKEQYQDIVEAEIDSGDFNSLFLKIRSLDFLGKYNSAYREYRINERTLLTGNFKEAVKLFFNCGAPKTFISSDYKLFTINFDV